MREGERIITPSMTAWPPTGRDGMGASGYAHGPRPGADAGREPCEGRYWPVVSLVSGVSAFAFFGA